MPRLTEKRALVTGAGSGIGRATALRLASEGAYIYCADIDLEGAKATAEQISREYHHNAVGGEIDVASLASCTSGVDAAIAAFGDLNVLCNIAGIFRPGHTTDLPVEDLDQTIAVNLMGTLYMCRAALPALLEGGGSIVNMASSAALQGVPYHAAYCASKAGIVGITQSLAAEYAKRDVRVNCICPGGVATPMTALGFPVEGIDSDLMKRTGPMIPRLGTPEEVAGLVAYLASEEAGFITGSALRIDGGQVA